MNAWEWIFWIAVILGILCWLFTGFWTDFPEVDEWEVLRDGIHFCVIEGTIDSAADITIALNSVYSSSRFSYKRRTG